jgi:hypothetical protein
MATVSGCIPAHVSGYEPSGPGKRESGYCIAGIRDKLLVEAPGGVGVHWWASRDEVSDRIMLDVYLTVPAGVTVRLRSPDVVLHSEAWSRPEVLAIEAISAPGPRTFEPDAALVGSDEPSMGDYSLRFFTPGKGMWAQTGIRAVPEFSASLPPLEINGQAWESAPVSFTESSRWGFYTCVQ